jgi:hypothetical protein
MHGRAPCGRARRPVDRATSISTAQGFQQIAVIAALRFHSRKCRMLPRWMAGIDPELPLPASRERAVNFTNQRSLKLTEAPSFAVPGVSS